jgi:hypothetical protein
MATTRDALDKELEKAFFPNHDQRQILIIFQDSLHTVTSTYTPNAYFNFTRDFRHHEVMAFIMSQTYKIYPPEILGWTGCFHLPKPLFGPGTVGHMTQAHSSKRAAMEAVQTLRTLSIQEEKQFQLSPQKFLDRELKRHDWTMVSGKSIAHKLWVQERMQELPTLPKPVIRTIWNMNAPENQDYWF